MGITPPTIHRQQALDALRTLGIDPTWVVSVHVDRDIVTVEQYALDGNGHRVFEASGDGPGARAVKATTQIPLVGDVTL